MSKHMDHLKQLKDFDENISREKQAKAKEEQEKMRAEVISRKESMKRLKQEISENEETFISNIRIISIIRGSQVGGSFYD